jgi:uncharacterized membrane protein YhdT
MAILTKRFRGFPQSLEAYAEIVPLLFLMLIIIKLIIRRYIV